MSDKSEVATVSVVPDESGAIQVSVNGILVGGVDDVLRLIYAAKIDIQRERLFQAPSMYL